MTNRHNPSSPTPIHPESPLHLFILICSVGFFSYSAARIGGALVLRPEMIWPFWPGCAFLVAMLLLTPSTIWPAVLATGLAGFALYDVQVGLPIRAISLLLLADSIEILVATLGVRYVFGGMPRLNNVKSMAKYSVFAVILAPIAVASLAASAFKQSSWWVAVLTEALALLTLTPAILSWADIALTRVKKSKVHYLEAALIFVVLAPLAYLAFAVSGSESRPALLYSLVPFLLWAALRFGITGTSTSMMLIAFPAIWGAVHGRGPFTGDTPVNDVLSLQLFLLVAAGSFMVLAAVVEEDKAAEQELATAHERLHLAIESGSVGGWEWDIKSSKTVWFGKAHAQLGMTTDEKSGSREEFWARVHKEDRERLRGAIQAAKRENSEFMEEFRVVWQDGTIRWLRSQGRYHYAVNGEPERLLGISIDITDTKQAEQALRENEHRLRLASQAGRMYAYEWDVTTDVVVRSSEHVKVVGLTEPLRSSHRQFVDKVYPDDRPKFLAAIAGLSPENPIGEVIYRALAPNGTLVWLKSNGLGFFDTEGKLLRVIGMVADMTDVKRAEEALAGMSRKLIEAQEQERTRIARDLHDDVAQRLALLAIGLEQVQQGLPDSIPELRNSVAALRKQTAQISTDVQTMSHELHSSKLEYLGIVVAMRSFCKEFGEQQKVEIDFRSQDVPSRLSPEISLCLFRVLQESLHNAAKHSGTAQFEVQLRGDSHEIHLIINDSGQGFDFQAAMQGRGLGLSSMRERVRLVDGTINIESKPMIGTLIHVRVPLASEHFSEEAAV